MKSHIVHLLNKQVEKYGDREVYRFKNRQSSQYESMSWNELQSIVTRVSCALLSLNYGYNSKIGIFANNCPEWAATDYGILGVRGIVVPFFGTATKEQLKYIVDETGMELMFVGNQEQGANDKKG